VFFPHTCLPGLSRMLPDCARAGTEHL
jgi:hypothetical protein